MTEAEAERAAVVAWLRSPTWSRMSLPRRLHFAVGMIFDPAAVAAAFFRLIANRIEAGAHREGE